MLKLALIGQETAGALARGCRLWVSTISEEEFVQGNMGTPEQLVVGKVAGAAKR
jgi:hypothetical protein